MTNVNRPIAIARIPALLMSIAVCVAALPVSGAQGRSGIHDFDFNAGTWRASIRRLVEAGSAHPRWIAYNGAATVQKVMDGYGSIEELDAVGSTGRVSILSVRLFNQTSGQWNIYGVPGDAASLSDPMIGGFNGTRGAFYSQQLSGGRVVLMRQRFYDISPSAYSFEQAASDDGGRTWKPNLRARLIRENLPAFAGTGSLAGASHDFDFNCGTWSTQITTFQRNKDGSTGTSSLKGRSR